MSKKLYIKVFITSTNKFRARITSIDEYNNKQVNEITVGGKNWDNPNVMSNEIKQIILDRCLKLSNSLKLQIDAIRNNHYLEAQKN